MTGVIIHSIHCRGYRGGSVGFDDSECDCGATIKSLTARLAAAEAAATESRRIMDLAVGRNEQTLAYIIDELKQRLAAAEAHEQQTHERLGAILGTDTSLEDAAKRMAERLAAAEAENDRIRKQRDDAEAERHNALERLTAAEAEELDAQDDARAQFDRYMDCEKAYRAMEREREDELAAVKKAGIVFQRMGTELVAINTPLDDATATLTARLAAAQVRNECPECGLTPKAISTCFCEECVGEIKDRLAAAEALNKPRMSLHAEIARLQDRLAAAEAALAIEKAFHTDTELYYRLLAKRDEAAKGGRDGT